MSAMTIHSLREASPDVLATLLIEQDFALGPSRSMKAQAG